MTRRLLAGFSIFDLVLITMMATLGVAIKPIVVPLSHILTGPLYIPGGVVAGGFYMLWLVLGYGLVHKRGTALLISLVQAILVVALGIFGTHGLVSLLTYTLPGLAVDLVYLIWRRGPATPAGAFAGGVAANVAGSVSVNLVFFRLPLIPLLLSLSVAALSGGLGGLIAYGLLQRLRRFHILGLSQPEGEEK